MRGLIDGMAQARPFNELNQATGTIVVETGRRLGWRAVWSDEPEVLNGHAGGLGSDEWGYQPMVEGYADRGIATFMCDWWVGEQRGFINPWDRIREFREFLERRGEFLPGALAGLPLSGTGHSAGSMTLQAQGGATFKDDSDVVVSSPDTIVSDLMCMVAFSPQGFSNASNTTQETFDTIERPVLYHSGLLDFGGFGEEQVRDPEWRRDGFKCGVIEPRGFAELRRGNHSHGGITGRDRYIPSQAEAVLELSAAHILAYAGDHGEAQLRELVDTPARPFSRLEYVFPQAA